MNTDAMSIPASQLLEELLERIERKRELLEKRNREYGEDRIHISSYMENLGWPELFDYDMNRYLSDAAFAMEVALRQKMFWLDNSLDDDVPYLWFMATVGMYLHMTLFGQEVTHSAVGVPDFGPHPIADQADLSLIQPVDFYTSGEMPRLIELYEEVKRVNESRYGGKLTIGFPEFHRGPLDIYIQLRGYTQFVEDTLDRPQFVHDFLERIVTERFGWTQERSRFLELPEPDEPTTRVADDWLNIPFISPATFTEFVSPAYRKIVENEGTVTDFHTCGILAPIIEELLDIFTGIEMLDVSGWNDFEELDRLVAPEVGFQLSFKNAFVLTGEEQRHRAALERVARLGERRKVKVCVQAIMRLHDTYEEDLSRMNRFIGLARDVFAGRDV